MKKIIALALCLMLALCAVSAVAEENTDEKTHLGTLEVGEAFRIQGKVPDNYTFNLITSNELNLIGVLAGGEGMPSVTVSIAYSEEYHGVERFNDLDEADVQDIKDSFLAMDDVVFEDLETAYGTRLLKVTQSDKTFVDIYTIYKGYELEFLLSADEEVQDADIQMLVDFISDMDFVTAE